MSREIFEVTKDRFHLQDPCCYILQGTWPKEAKMRAMLDGSEIKSEIQRLEVVSALERFKDPDLMRGELLSLDNPYHCPHGRPTIIAMTKRELEKKFKRIV